MLRILLVDDDEPLRTALRLMLLQMGHEVTEARHGKEALQICRIVIPDVVLTDLIMPEKEGLETIQELRVLHPKLKIIAMSGGGRGKAADYLAIARKMGAAYTLDKPFSYERLVEAITAVGG